MGNKVLVANLTLSPITKAEFLQEVKSLLDRRKQTFITTPNSEFLFAALSNPQLRDLFNSADIALADGIAIMWAERFLAMPLRSKMDWARRAEAWLQVAVSGARILLAPRSLYQTIPEKITGAEIFFDIVAIAAAQSAKVYLVNDWGQSAALTARKLKERYPNLEITVSTKGPEDQTLVGDIRQVKPDLLFLAYGQPKQEKWIHAHLAELPVVIAMGVGGTFDYAAGVKLQPPRWVRSAGLEWLFRLITQPHRWKRIYQATFGLVGKLVDYKLTIEKTSQT